MHYCEVVRTGEPLQRRSWLMGHLPPGNPSRILIKPNWVRHEEDPAFPIKALVTSSGLIEAVIDACLDRYLNLEEITVGDVPLQSCNWEKLVAQADINRLEEKYGHYRKPLIRFLDLRRECAVVTGGFVQRVANPSGGDPKGYREVLLDQASLLEPISAERDYFRVSDHSPEQTISSHRRGLHRYMVARSALDCDLFINLPKVKTHQKSGVTGALKNLVGINGEKAYLVHYRKADHGMKGDEFPPGVPFPIILQTRIREAVQGRSKILFSMLRGGWKILRKAARIETRGTVENLRTSNGRFYMSAGSWYGNDTIWRMVYDLNRVVRYARRDGGELASSPQREYLAIADGIIAGEGNGPLQPLPVELGVLIASRDPFLLDTVMAQVMGFDYLRIPILSNAACFSDTEWGTFDPLTVGVSIDGQVICGIRNIPILHSFIAPPGWKNKVEIDHFEVPA